MDRNASRGTSAAAVRNAARVESNIPISRSGARRPVGVPPLDLAQMMQQKATPVPSAEDRPTSRLDAPRPHYDAHKMRAHVASTPRSQYHVPTNQQSRGMASTPRMRHLGTTVDTTNEFDSSLASKCHKEKNSFATPHPEEGPKTFKYPSHPAQSKGGAAPSGRPGFGAGVGRPATRSQRTANGRPGTQYLARQQGHMAQGGSTTMNAPATRGREGVPKVSLTRQPTSSGMRGKTPGQETPGAQGWSGGRPEAWGFAMPKRGAQKAIAEDGHQAEGCRPSTRGRDAVQKLVTPGDF